MRTFSENLTFELSIDNISLLPDLFRGIFPKTREENISLSKVNQQSDNCLNQVALNIEDDTPLGRPVVTHRFT